MGLDYFIDQTTMDCLDRTVRNYCEKFKSYDTSRLFQLKAEISPKGVLDFASYFFSDRPFKMDAINTLLEGRRIQN